MPLPPPAARRPAHTRTTAFRGYQRDDGLWDIEAEMQDTKPFAFALNNGRELAPNEAIHHMHIRVTVDEQLVVRDIATVMGSFPHGQCAEADRHMRRMIGSTMGKGWRKSIDRHLGGVEGCTHMRELLYNMATAAFQTIAPQVLARWHGADAGAQTLPPPPHLGACMTWDFNGPAVEQIYPMYFEWPLRQDNTAAPGTPPSGRHQAPAESTPAVAVPEAD
ncbi:DUF2889 domain-containing protein [Corticibacter populi]|uniref:DUF2889 domain-containing protein n=1 Tax=Corticibacter populi TaxID=1550736 RepID=A0A3M6QZX7_9BURK|nr:DUF2889 domain-containing protein [Corticibacter populi]RMX08574.1 DUF2889 domain-containing protein [Corticibacter populi]RZS35896.1 DUF2889 family protein [Corticibacter populi]